MLKKRLIFTLLFADGHFMLSRNFRLQRVGDLKWLQCNYNFSRIAFFIDELIVLDVSRGERDFAGFCNTVKALSQGCFAPLAAGGGIRSVEQAIALLRSGADKVLLNTPVFTDRGLVLELARELGEQCLVASMDFKKTEDGEYQVWVDSGNRAFVNDARICLEDVQKIPVGEVYLNSMDRDGTGQGYDFDILSRLPPGFAKPVILAGGVGNAGHLSAGLKDSRVDAVATAHLFNFVGDGLQNTREELKEGGINLPHWNHDLLPSQGSM